MRGGSVQVQVNIDPKDDAPVCFGLDPGGEVFRRTSSLAPYIVLQPDPPPVS